MAVGLAELIGRLRAELTGAMTGGEQAGPGFDLGPVGLELTADVEKEAKPGTKVRFWVAEAGAARTGSPKGRLVLDPRRAGQPYREPPNSGAEHPGER